MSDDTDGRRPAADPADGADADDADEDAPAPTGDGTETAADGREWRFALDEVGEDAEPARPPIEPGSPSLENALFVVVGVVGTVLLLLGSV